MILVFISLGITAQHKPIIFGIKIAPNAGWMKPSTEGYSNDGVLPGLSWGFVADFFLMEHYSILTGFNVIYLNGRMEMPYAKSVTGDSLLHTGTLNRTYKTKYIELPLVFKMRTNISEKVKLFGKIGLGTGFRLSSKAEDVFTWEGGEEESNSDITDDIQFIRSSLIIGGGVSYHFKGSTALVLDITFNNGFVDILSGTNPGVSDLDQKANSNFIELGIGMMF